MLLVLSLNIVIRAGALPEYCNRAGALHLNILIELVLSLKTALKTECTKTAAEERCKFLKLREGELKAVCVEG